ncbi:MAG: hypothetical protein Q4F79_09035 [Eubacteriales bacterium]|nr:hypothetical protein [Eubacteriales bacterium]
MEQQQIPKNMKKYIIAYRYLLDVLDEYQEDIVTERRENCHPQRRQEIRNRIARRCRKEAREVFSRIPRQEKRYRGLRWVRRLCWLGGCLSLGLAVVLLLEAVVCHQVFWCLFGLIALTSNRIFDKISGIAQDHLVWSIMETEYKPVKTVWSEEQKQLLPERLHSCIQPLSCTVEPQDCIRGKLKCFCGSEVFSVWRHPTAGYLRAVCPDCKREIVLFDEHLDAHHADGKAQQYFPNVLEMALCRSCKSELHGVTLTIVCDEERTFFQENPAQLTEESGFCMLFQMHCADCGMLTGEGRYVWNAQTQQAEEEERQA